MKALINIAHLVFIAGSKEPDVSIFIGPQSGDYIIGRALNGTGFSPKHCHSYLQDFIIDKLQVLIVVNDIFCAPHKKQFVLTKSKHIPLLSKSRLKTAPALSLGKFIPGLVS